MSERAPLRLFLDSNVLTGGIVAPWGLDKAVLSLCAARICRLVLAEIVRQEVEENLLQHAAVLPAQEAEQVLADYTTLLTLTRPERVPLPDAQDVASAGVGTVAPPGHPPEIPDAPCVRHRSPAQRRERDGVLAPGWPIRGGWPQERQQAHTAACCDQHQCCGGQP